MTDKTNRQKWKELLPIIQAFVDGKPIQKLSYSGRWEDTTTMLSVLYSQHRITPGNLVYGTWSIIYTSNLQGSDGPVAHGTMRWEGTNLDTPPWPTASLFEYDKSTETFIPKPIDLEGLDNEP